MVQGRQEPVSSAVRVRNLLLVEEGGTVLLEQVVGRNLGNLRRYIHVDTGFHRCDKPKL
jgi:hypothetical protein